MMLVSVRAVSYPQTLSVFRGDEEWQQAIANEEMRNLSAQDKDNAGRAASIPPKWGLLGGNCGTIS
jgi:hypothetical protein